MIKFKLLFIPVLLIVLISAKTIDTKPDFRIRTITAGISLSSISDTTSILQAIKFLNESKEEYQRLGYEVQTTRISTQSLHKLISKLPDSETIRNLKVIDQIAIRENVSLSIGELINGDHYDSNLTDWVVQLNNATTNISFSIPISSKSNGIHLSLIHISEPTRPY